MHQTAPAGARSDPRARNPAPRTNGEQRIRRSASQAIRDFCVECGGDSYGEVEECSAGPDKYAAIGLGPCPLYRFRMGSQAHVGRGGRLKAIRQHCRVCMGDHASSRRYVAECTSTGCHLWPYRMGKRPKGTNMSTRAERREACKPAEEDSEQGQTLRRHFPCSVPRASLPDLDPPDAPARSVPPSKAQGNEENP